MGHLQAAAIINAATISQRLNVAHRGRRGHHHRRTGQPGPPAQVQVLAVQVDIGVKAVERREQVGAHQRGGTGDEKHVPDGVVLALIQLAAFHQRSGLAEPVTSHAQCQQSAGIVVLDQLGANHPGVGPERLGHHQRDRVRRQHDVVMAEQVKGGSGHADACFVAGRTEPGVGVQTQDGGTGNDGGDPVGNRHAAGGINHHQRHVCVGLGDH